MSIEGLERIVGGHRLFAGLSPEFLELVTGCAKNVVIEPGTYLFHEGDPADEIYLIRDGHIGLEIAAPGHGRMTFMTAGPDEVIGLSWLIPPYRHSFDAHVKEATRAITMDATCLRNKCEADAALGYEVMKRVMPTIVDRLHATRLQMLDVYGTKS